MHLPATFFLLLLLSLPLMAQAVDDPQPPVANPSENAEIIAEETVTEEEVWSGDADEEDEIFIPSESVSADASIAFPADI